MLAESELDGIQISDEPEELRFDDDPLQFRLGVEAQRIDVAFAYEMAAVAVSNIQPLPHQLLVGARLWRRRCAARSHPAAV